MRVNDDPADAPGTPLAAAIPPWPPDDEEIAAALTAAWRDGSWGRYHGPHVPRLAQLVAERHGATGAHLCASGTIAVELALRGVGVGPGAEVVLAAYDFPGNFRAIEAIGARPVLVDIDPRTWCLDAGQLAAAASDATRAVVVSHLHGGLADMPAIVEWAAARGAAVVEDACQCPGATLAGRAAGSWGDVGVWSFGGSKLLSAGRGGAVFTRHAEVQQRIKIYCDRGNLLAPLAELQAAVLLPQLARLDERNRQRQAAVARLLAATADMTPLRPVAAAPAGSSAAYYKLAWLCDQEALGGAALGEVVAALQALGVPVDRGFRSFAGRSERRCRKVGSLACARRAGECTLLLHHPILLGGAAAIDLLAAAIRQGLEQFARN